MYSPVSRPRRDMFTFCDLQALTRYNRIKACISAAPILFAIDDSIKLHVDPTGSTFSSIVVHAISFADVTTNDAGASCFSCNESRVPCNSE